MAKAERGEGSLYISPLVLAEIIGVLDLFARYAMTAIAHVIISLVSAPGIEVDHRELIVRTVELARDRNVDFADA
jgi:predicted nucleic-acid-binding protein